jgi:peptidyl-prolyl cis-trans isomerase C
MNTPSRLLLTVLLSAAVSAPASAQTAAPAAKAAPTAAPAAAPAASNKVATVNGVAIPKSRVDAIVKERAQQGMPDNEEMRKAIRDELINREIIVQEANRRGLTKNADMQSQIDMARQAVVVRAFLQDFVKAHPVTDEVIKAEYEKVKGQMGSKEYKARHILVEKEDQAKALLAQLKKGAKFEDLAKKSSKDPGSAVKGGELDWANPASYVKEFSDALVALGKGKTTEAPVKSQFGFHIIRLDDVREANMPKFEDVKPQISQHLTQQNLAKYQEELRSKAKIE